MQRKSKILCHPERSSVFKKILRFAQDDSRRAAGVDYRYTKFIFTMNLICY